MYFIIEKCKYIILLVFVPAYSGGTYTKQSIKIEIINNNNTYYHLYKLQCRSLLGDKLR
jgi:hypothetical protein